jgi:hypothetical protein
LRAEREFIEMWMLDPFITIQPAQVVISLQLGITEDILKDGRKV